MLKIKLIIFVQFIVFVTVLGMYLASAFIGADITVNKYLVTASIGFIVSVLTVYIIVPISEWFFDL